MILTIENAGHHNGPRNNARFVYPDNHNAASEIIADMLYGYESDAFGSLLTRYERRAGFIFADLPYDRTRPRQTSEAILQVSINTETAYGGLLWCSPARWAQIGSMYEHVWVSDNPTPPDADPKIVSDTGVPYYFDRRSTLPISEIRKVLEEFCQACTGERPESIQWTQGELNGLRYDSEAYGLYAQGKRFTYLEDGSVQVDRTTEE